MARQTMVYDSVEEANNRIVGTIVTYDGRPVQVVSAEDHEDGIIRLRIREFPFNGRERGGEDTRKKINSPLFRRFVTPPLGYCNYFERDNASAIWCERVSARTRRQGLCGEVFNGVSHQGYRVEFDALSRSEAFREMIAGEYPSFDDALGRLFPNSCIAISRDFALHMGVEGFTYLYWRRDPVALVVRGAIMLRNDKQHLIETLRDCRALPDRVEIL